LRVLRCAYKRKHGLRVAGEVDADTKFDATLKRHAGIALGHASLHLDGAAHGVNDAAELDDCAVAGALDDAAMMSGNRRVNEIGAKTS
jgi:hypothetical protein